MKETILSVGIDIGTSTTQLIFSKLTILALGMPILLALLETIHAFLT